MVAGADLDFKGEEEEKRGKDRLICVRKAENMVRWGGVVFTGDGHPISWTEVGGDFLADVPLDDIGEMISGSPTVVELACFVRSPLADCEL